MTQLFKYLFSRVYIFYRDVLHVNSNAHYYTSFVVSVLVFENMFVLINILSLLFFQYMPLTAQSINFIYLGNIVMFLIFILSSFNRNYLMIIKEIQTLANYDRKRLSVICNIYVALSLMVEMTFYLLN